MRQRIPRSVFFLLFAVSGFAGLIYESIWSHYLKLFLGHAAYAQTLVLAIFMGGMAIGAWVCAAFVHRWRNLLLGYAVAELFIGFFALVFHWIFVTTTAFAYDNVLPYLGPFSIGVFKWTLAALLILPQSVLLGMTFPLMSGAIMRLYPDTPGASLSMLYFTNSLGAAIGVLASGFYLLDKFGMPGTILTAGLMNVALALCVWAIGNSIGSRTPSAPAPASHEQRESASKPGEKSFLQLLLAAALISGAASFCYEIGWIRMLSLVLGSSTHAFEIMLSAFILGIAFGGLWIKKRIDGYRSVVGVLGIVLAGKGVLALATLPVYGNTFELMQLTITSLAKTEFSYTVFNLVSHLISLSVMFPAAFCAGMSLPLITVALLQRGYGESSVGKVYAWNTLGAIFGVLFAIHVALPYLGLKGTIVAGAIADIAIALALLWKLDHAGSFVRRGVVSAASVLAILVAVNLVTLDAAKMASGVYRVGNLETFESSEAVFHRDGKTATIDVVRHGTTLSIRTNGKPDATLETVSPAPMPDEFTMVLAAALPMAHMPNARTVANIGFGSGLTTHALLANPLIKSVDSVEIEPAMIEGARNFGPLVARAYSDPRSVIHIDDAKSYFASRNAKYDVIVSEPSNPWISGVSTLFSEEFYKQIKRHMNEGAVLVQWVQLYEIDTRLVSSIFTALGANFSDYVVYDSDGGNLLILAVPTGTIGALDPAALQAPLLAAHLARLGIHGVNELGMQRVGRKKTLHKLFLSFGAPANSDYFPIVDLNAPKSRFLQTTATEIVALGIAPIPVMDMLDGEPIRGIEMNTARRAALSPRVRRSIAANDLREYFLTGAFPPESRFRSAFRLSMSYARDKLVSCNGPDKDDVWFPPLFEAAQLISVYLPPAESAKVWQLMEGSKCFGKLSEAQRDWIRLFRSVGDRNAAAMADISGKLLETQTGLSSSEAEYLLMAGMTGLIAGQDRAAALRMWDKYSREIPTEGRPSLALRLLSVHARFGD
jgi:spermidine synthase